MRTSVNSTGGCDSLAMTAAGVGVEETARRLGRHCSTVYRELGRGGYDARAAQTAAGRRARRPKTPVLAADPVLAAAALSRLRDSDYHGHVSWSLVY